MTYPIILQPGVCRFDILWNRALRVDDSEDARLDNLHYFKGIRTMLRAAGYAVYHSRVAWAGRVSTRAENLKKNLRRVLAESGAPKANIIAHSMGGLDARHMLFSDRREGKIHQSIASLTTIGTPHAGSAFADWGLQKFSSLPGFFTRIGLDIEGLTDLQTDPCRSFNENPEVRAFEAECESAIQFRTYAGKQDFRGTLFLLKGSHRIIAAREGENDGLVSVQSAVWRQKYFQGALDSTDHLNELGWWDPDQVLAGETPRALRERIHRFYRSIAEQLP